MIKFPSIEQYRHVIKNVKVHADGAFLPTLTFRGTTKIHGTNAAIRLDDTGYSYQSRSRVLSEGDDNAGFRAAMEADKPNVIHLFDAVADCLSCSTNSITIFGEWCGQGIQRGVAVANVARMFVYFAVRIEPVEGAAYWLDVDTVNFCSPVIYNIIDFYSEKLVIDFNNPEYYQDPLIKLTEAVEACCPVGKALGQEGIGEGIVWTCVTPGWESSKFWMKVKGEKHSVSKVKTLAAVDVEALATVQAFLDYAVTPARIAQGLEFLRDEGHPLEMESTGHFIRWVYNDILKEETDTIIENGLDPKKLGSPVAARVRPLFIGALNAE